jgi:hypothetical protein
MLHLVQCYNLTFLQCGVELVNEVYTVEPWQASALIILFVEMLKFSKKLNFSNRIFL